MKRLQTPSLSDRASYREPYYLGIPSSEAAAWGTPCSTWSTGEREDNSSQTSWLALLYPRRFHHLGTLPYKLPLLLFLRDHSLSIQEIPEYTLAKRYTPMYLGNWTPDAPEWIEQQLDKGRCLILLDGLTKCRYHISPADCCVVERQMTIYARIALWSPLALWLCSNPLRKVTILEVQPFTFKQVTRFVNDCILPTRSKHSARWSGCTKEAKEGTQIYFGDCVKLLHSLPLSLILCS